MKRNGWNKTLFNRCYKSSIPFSVADFKEYGETALKEILNKAKLPMIVGGQVFT